MDKLKNVLFKFINEFKCFIKWIKRGIYIVLAACMIGLSNVYYDECRMVDNTKNFVEQEQVIDNEE